MISDYSNSAKLKEKISNKFAFLRNKESFFYYVLTLIGVGFLFFGYALITQKFTTPYSGDFSQQSYQLYYDFYDDWWTFFKTGQFPFYDSNTFLGADNVFANTYYGLFSPFTFPILFVPRSFIPHMMAIISIARLVTGGILFRLYLRYMGVSEKNARLFSISYAFMGWMAYYLWFNPFYEVMTFFPLILFGIEKIIKEKQVIFAVLGFFLLGISNYFFLLSIGIFSVIYAGFRYFQTIKSRNAKDNILVIVYGFFGFLFGLGLSMFCVFPAVIASFSITRAEEAQYLNAIKASLKEGNYSEFFKLFFTCWSSSVTNYGSAYESYYFSFVFPLCSYFYPTVSDRFTNIMHYKWFENTGSSIFIYTPNMILLGCSIYRSIKNKKISHFIAMFGLVTALFVPFVYFLFGAFVTPYGRWEIIVPVAAITYIAINFDHKEEIPTWVVITSGVVTFAFMLMTYFLSQYIVLNYDYFIETGLMILLVIYQLILTVVETGLIAGFWKKKHVTTVIRTSFIVEIFAVGTLVANIHSLQSISTSVGGGYNNVPTETRIIKEINDSDKSYFRLSSSRVYEGNSNLGMLENFNGLGTFHTFYNNDIDDFLRFSQVMMNDTAWNGTISSKRVNLDAFLGVKYYVSKDSDTMFTFTSSDGEKTKVVYEPNIPLNYERIDSDDDGYRVYKNKYQINLGTSLDTLYFKNECECSIYNSFYPYYAPYEYVLRNEEAYFNGAILNNDDVYEIMREYGDVFNYEEAPDNNAKNAKSVNYLIKGIYVGPAIYDNEGNITGYKYFDPSNPDRDIIDSQKVDISSDEIPANRYQVVLEPNSSTGYFPIGDEGAAYYINYPIRQSSGTNYSATVYLIGENEDGTSKVITFDNCRDFSRSSARSIRALYSKEKVKRIIICVDGEKYWNNYFSFHYEPFEDCINRFTTAIDNGLNDITYNVNTFTFNTNYSSPRFVVTQLAYTGGWKVYAKVDGEEKELKVYNSQGGFAGFVAPKGEVSYVMKYETPHIKEGLAMTFVSLFGGGGLSALGFALANKKKKQIS